MSRSTSNRRHRPGHAGRRATYLCNHTFSKANKDPLTLFTSARVWVANCKINVTHFCSEKYTKLVNEASATLDGEKRRQIFREISEIMLAENFCLTIAPSFRGYVRHKRVQGARSTWTASPYGEALGLRK